MLTAVFIHSRLTWDHYVRMELERKKECRSYIFITLFYILHVNETSWQNKITFAPGLMLRIPNIRSVES